MNQIVELNAVEDPRLECYSDLRTAGGDSSGTGFFVVEGKWCLERLAQSRHPIRSVLVERGKEHLAAAVIDSATPIFSLPPDCVRNLVGFDFHRGVMACGIRPKLKRIDELNLGGNEPPVALAILGVDQHENLGSIMRTAAALGVRDMLIGPRTADPYARRSVRVSMAAVLHQDLYDLDRPAQQFGELSHQRGYRTIATTLRSDATPLHEFVVDERPCVLAVGNEANGIDPEIEQLATDRVTIPMHFGTDSLNVSIATAIFLYALVTAGR